MGTFRRRPDFSRLPSNLVYDPTHGDPNLVALREAVLTRDWSATTGLLDQAADHDELTYLVDFAAAYVDSQDWLSEILAKELNSTHALLLHGARHIVWAWEARGRRRAHETGRDQFELFHERLRIAEDCLQSVVRRDPGNATAWAQLITTARGLSLGLPEARRRFEQATRAQPWHAVAHIQMLQNACPKWAGSVNELREFVASSLAHAPDGHHVWILVPHLHFELAANMDDPKQRIAYFKSGEVREALRAAAARSVTHPDFQRVRDWALVANWFAAMFAINEDWRSAAPVFRLIDRWFTPKPWGHFAEDPGGVFIATRNKAYLKE